MEYTHVEGKDQGKIVLYALSTCVWCKKTKKFLEDQKVAYDYIYVDLLPEEKQEELEEYIGKFNESLSYPTIIFNDTDCVVGYKPGKIKGALKK